MTIDVTEEYWIDYKAEESVPFAKQPILQKLLTRAEVRRMIGRGSKDRITLTLEEAAAEITKLRAMIQILAEDSGF
jgi:soluble P-type ATPase